MSNLRYPTNLYSYRGYAVEETPTVENSQPVSYYTTNSAVGHAVSALIESLENWTKPPCEYCGKHECWIRDAWSEAWV